MLNRSRNYVLIAVIFYAILGLSEACSASTVNRFKARGHSHSRRVAPTALRTGHQTRVVALRADLLLSSQKTITLDDAVDASEESEDDQGDEPRDALPQTNSPISFITLDCVEDAIRPATVLRPLARESGIPGMDRPRFLSLCRWLI